jgi:hypothetical protein
VGDWQATLARTGATGTPANPIDTAIVVFHKVANALAAKAE